MNAKILTIPALASVMAMQMAMAGEGPKSVKYTAVTLRPLPMPSWSGMQSGSVDPAAKLVEGIRSGDVEAVDEALDSGSLGIDEPICFATGRVGETIETGKIAWHLVSVAPKMPNPSGDPMKMPFMPSMPAVSAFGDSWSGAIGGMGDYNLPASANLHGTPLMVAARFGNSFMLQHLLERGANPNVFIVVGRADNGLNGWLGASTDQVSRPYLFALEECYRTGGAIRGKTREKMDECAGILIAAGAVLPPKDKQGRNGLWDAAIARSVPMLELALKSGIDVNDIDHLDKTVSDYIAETRSRAPELAAFAKALRDKGAKGTTPATEKVQPQPMGEGEDDVLPPQAGGMTRSRTVTYPGGTVSSSTWVSGGVVMPGGSAVDNAGEIADLERSLVALRKQLLDAEHDADMAAIRGTGWITASMRVQNIMQAISEIEGRLLELQR